MTPATELAQAAKVEEGEDRVRVSRPVVLPALDVPRQAPSATKRGAGAEGQATDAIPVADRLVTLPDEGVLGRPGTVVAAAAPVLRVVQAQVRDGPTPQQAMSGLPVSEVAAA